MSYKNRWEVEREGERAYERGRSAAANPYDHFGDYDEETNRSHWDYGYRNAELRAKENQEREESERRESERRSRECYEFEQMMEAQREEEEST